MWMSRKKVYVAMILTVIIVGGGVAYFSVVRLQKRHAIRRDLGPIIRVEVLESEDFLKLEDHSGNMTFGEFSGTVELQIEERSNRIRQVRLYDFGPYREAQEKLVDLMWKNNEFVRAKDSNYASLRAAGSAGQNLQNQMKVITLQLRLEMAIAGLRSRSEKIRSAHEYIDDLEGAVRKVMEAVEQGEESQRHLEATCRQAGESRDKAFGWIRWIGVAIESDNPFRTSCSRYSVDKAWIAKVRKEFEALKHVVDGMRKNVPER